jgi:hypothetical protein
VPAGSTAPEISASVAVLVTLISPETWPLPSSTQSSVAIWFTALSAALFGVLGVLAPLRLAALGAGAVTIGAVFLVSAALEAAASPRFGRLTDRHGPLPVLAFGLACSSLVAALLPLPGSVWPLAIAMVAAGPCFGVAWVPASVLLSAAADSEGLHQGLAYALWNLALGARRRSRCSARRAARSAHVRRRPLLAPRRCLPRHPARHAHRPALSLAVNEIAIHERPGAGTIRPHLR